MALEHVDGVTAFGVVKSIYRDIRALRICEGASDVQQVAIARSILARDMLAALRSSSTIATPRGWSFNRYSKSEVGRLSGLNPVQ